MAKEIKLENASKTEYEKLSLRLLETIGTGISLLLVKGPDADAAQREWHKGFNDLQVRIGDLSGTNPSGAETRKRSEAEREGLASAWHLKPAALLSNLWCCCNRPHTRSLLVGTQWNRVFLESIL